MPQVSYLEQFPIEKLSLALHTIPLSFLFLGFHEFFFSHMIKNWISTIVTYFSRSTSSSVQYKSGLSSSFKAKHEEKKNQDFEESSQEHIDDGNISREDVEMVMENLGLFSQPENLKLQERFSSDEFSHMFEEQEASLDEVKEAFDIFVDFPDVISPLLFLSLIHLGFVQNPTTVPPPMDPSSQYQQQQQWYQQQQQSQFQQPQHYQQQPPQPMYYPQQPPSQAAVPLPQQAQYGAQPAAASGDEIRTLWIGDLQYFMDENYLLTCFSHSGEVVSAKVIRNKSTNQSDGYGFIEFVSRDAAERNLQTYNGTPMPNVQQNFRLNWASLGAGEKRPDDSAAYTIFVGDLAGDVTDYTLQETFRVHYPSVRGAKVVTDRETSRSKGYGFVKFGDENEQLRAMTEMNGSLCSTRPMRIGPAANKKIMDAPQYPKATYQNNTQGAQSVDDPNNTTIFVGGLDSSVSDEYLTEVFSTCGQVVSVKIPVGKRCGFVQFADRACAEEALNRLNGSQLGGQSVRLSWGRTPSNKQPQVATNQGNGGGYYGYGQGYETYGYAPPAQAPNLYYGGYPAYGNYPQNQQQQQQQQQPQ